MHFKKLQVLSLKRAMKSKPKTKTDKYDKCVKCGRKIITGPVIIRKGKLLCSLDCWELVAKLGEEPEKL